MDRLPVEHKEITTESERATWMAGVGGFVFTRTLEDNFQNVLDEVPDDLIISKFSTDDNIYTTPDKIIANVANIFCAITDHLSENPPTNFSALTRITPAAIENFEPFTSGLGKYTFKSTLTGVMLEAYTTMLTTPLNILLAAENKRPDTVPPLFRSESDIAKIYRSTWFNGVTTNSAFTKNELWQNFSTTAPISHENANYELLHSGILDFERQEDTEGNPIFAFSPTAIKQLRAKLSYRNMQASKFTPIEDSATGSSIGCPAIRRTPSQIDSHTLTQLAQIYDTTTECIMTPRQSSTFHIALNSLAGFIDRATHLAKTR